MRYLNRSRFEVEEMSFLPLDDGFPVVSQGFFDAHLILIKPVLMNFLLYRNGQVGRLSHQSLELFPLLRWGVQTVVYGQLACHLGHSQT